MINKLSKTLAAIAVCVASAGAQAAWDGKFLPNTDGLQYYSNYFVVEGNVRSVRELTSLHAPDAQGNLYIENVTEYNCAQNTFQVVQSTGFRSWNDRGDAMPLRHQGWQNAKPNSNEQLVLNRLCTKTLADAKKFID